MRKIFSLILAAIVVSCMVSCRDNQDIKNGKHSVHLSSETAVAAKDSVKKADTVAVKQRFIPHKGFVLVRDLIPDVIEEIRYNTDYNFVGERIDGYQASCAILTDEAARALKAVADELRPQGYRIKIYDAYRPKQAVKHFVRWSRDIKDQKMKQDFYPELDKSVLFKRGYISSHSGHSRGSTIDLTLTDLKGNNLDMGGVFDYFGKRSHPDYKGDLTEQQIANRMLLRNTMKKHGFRPMSTEWWHFTLRNEPYPDTFFDFPVTDK